MRPLPTLVLAGASAVLLSGCVDARGPGRGFDAPPSRTVIVDHRGPDHRPPPARFDRDHDRHDRDRSDHDRHDRDRDHRDRGHDMHRGSHRDACIGQRGYDPRRDRCDERGHFSRR